MVDTAPLRWVGHTSERWYPVDEVEFITAVMANGQWTTDTIVDVEVTFDRAGWLLWREVDQLSGGAFASDKVVHIEWAIP